MSKQIHVGSVPVGGGADIAIQSMCNTRTEDVAATVAQILRLEEAGCDIIRVAVPDMAAAQAVGRIRRAIHIPLVADIHFDYKLALECVRQGIDKIRINPGNIGGEDRVRAVVEACGARSIPIRIGVNGGSLEPRLLEKYGHPTPEALRDSALYHASLLEKYDFTDIVLSMKSSHVPTMVRAYQLASQACDYPLHLGVTEAGTERMGLVKSSAGIGALLLEGVGDTIRVSLTADPVREIYAAKDLLKALEIETEGIQFISCPTCGRTKIDLIGLANQVQEALRDCKKNLTVAVMGCVVNGPGEAREADIGIAGGNGEGLLFKKGQVLRKVPEERLLQELLKEIESMD